MSISGKSSVSVTEAKANFVELCDRAAAGETIVITRWGKPTAMLRPLARQLPGRNPGEDEGTTSAT